MGSTFNAREDAAVSAFEPAAKRNTSCVVTRSRRQPEIYSIIISLATR